VQLGALCDGLVRLLAFDRFDGVRQSGAAVFPVNVPGS
jgi:hypothetical protein